jgi:rhamnogalacturonyl hydrolase YesR
MQKLSVSHQEAMSAYVNLSDATMVYGELQSKLIKKEAALDTYIAEGTMAGIVTGKNPDERKASARQAYKAIYDEVERDADEVRHAKLVMEVADIEVKKINTLIRLDELLELIEQHQYPRE